MSQLSEKYEEILGFMRLLLMLDFVPDPAAPESGVKPDGARGESRI